MSLTVVPARVTTRSDLSSPFTVSPPTSRSLLPGDCPNSTSDSTVDPLCSSTPLRTVFPSPRPLPSPGLLASYFIYFPF